MLRGSTGEQREQQRWLEISDGAAAESQGCLLPLHLYSAMGGVSGLSSAGYTERLSHMWGIAGKFLQI